MSLLRHGIRNLNKKIYPQVEGVFLVGGNRWIVRGKIFKHNNYYFTSLAQFKTEEGANEFFKEYKLKQ